MKLLLPFILCFLLTACKTVDMTVLNDVPFLVYQQQKAVVKKLSVAFLKNRYK
ncbi:hypothetical protein ACSQ7D_01285 [Capnocytophaga sp. G1920]|uniref:hypothetical protein n=1 Tax=Capnocytophaga TaxID=1016 RepID=UPI002231398B|nr:hypothetical protein [Capnocytophaga ochracea]UZD37392.1 hypothetical protein OLG90_05820 [Capnocytophaga ochracea]